MMHVFRALALLKGLRGTIFDIFGYAQERREERRLIVEYESLLDEIAQVLTPGNHDIAVALAAIPDKIRGFGHVKQRHLAAARAEQAQLLQRLRAAPAAMPAAAE